MLYVLMSLESTMVNQFSRVIVFQYLFHTTNLKTITADMPSSYISFYEILYASYKY